jgi:hypothetical protein
MVYLKDNLKMTVSQAGFFILDYLGGFTGWSQSSSGWSCASLTARPCILVARPSNLAYPLQFLPD